MPGMAGPPLSFPSICVDWLGEVYKNQGVKSPDHPPMGYLILCVFFLASPGAPGCLSVLNPW